MEGPNVESRTWPTDFGKDNDRKDRTGCFVEFFAQNFFCGIYCTKTSVSSTTSNWPVGAMVARSPPKAEAVGSSPTSVAFFCPFHHWKLFAELA